MLSATPLQERRHEWRPDDGRFHHCRHLSDAPVTLLQSRILVI